LCGTAWNIVILRAIHVGDGLTRFLLALLPGIAAAALLVAGIHWLFALLLAVILSLPAMLIFAFAVHRCLLMMFPAPPKPLALP
jgi:hypothetical protein